MAKRRWLSKSQINTFQQCPYKWKLLYIDKRKSEPNPAMARGIQVHSNIESFYKNVDVKAGKIVSKKPLGELGQFQKFEQKRIQSCVDEKGKFNLKYFKPLFQELMISDPKLMLRGVVDAIYVHPKDKGIIIIDWKTGKYRPNFLSKYRFELAVYKELLERKMHMNAKYWGIYFVDADKLFFEEVKSISIKAMYKTVEKVRAEIKAGDYKCKPGILCNWCEFSGECEAWK